MVLIDGGNISFELDPGDGSTMSVNETITYTIAIDADEVTIGRFAGWVGAQMPLPADKQSLDPGGPYENVMVWDAANWNGPASTAGFYGNTDAGSCYGAGGGSPQPTYSAANVTNHPGYPVNCVSWAQALAFCWWDGHKRLPTDTEWHIAATSRGANNSYPWGTTNPPMGTGGCRYSVDSCNGGSTCAFPVGAGFADAGATPLGIYDLVGSLNEWGWDWFANGTNYWYPSMPPPDYAGPDGGGGANPRVYVANGWSACNESALQAPNTGTTDPYDDAGFRCVKTLP